MAGIGEVEAIDGESCEGKCVIVIGAGFASRCGGFFLSCWLCLLHVHTVG